MATAHKTISRLAFGSAREEKRIILDFQGGGANLAYSIGFAIEFLRDPHIRVIGVRGTSAGAMISCLIADAINSAPDYRTGCERAIDKLNAFLNELVAETAPIMHTLQFWSDPLNLAKLQSTAASIAASYPHGGHGSAMEASIDMTRSMLAFNPLTRMVANVVADSMQAMHRHMLHGALRDAKQSPNLPVLNTIVRNQEGLAGIFGQAATQHSAAVATETLRRLVTKNLHSIPHPHDREDRIFPHVASGRFVKVHVNTAKIVPHGLENVIHGGEDVTSKALLGSAALKTFFQPSVIKGEKHIDGGYTQNGCLSVPMSEYDEPCHAIMIVGTNRPREIELKACPRPHLNSDELAPTRGLDLHQMYSRALHMSEQWREGEPTIHLTTFDHHPADDWTAKQNTSVWNIQRLLESGLKDGRDALELHRPHFGICCSVEKEMLEATAREGAAMLHRERRRHDGYEATPYAA